MEDSDLLGCEFLTLRIKALVFCSVGAYTRHIYDQIKGRGSRVPALGAKL